MGQSVWSFDDGYGDNKLYNGKEEIILPSHCTSWKKKMKNDINVVDINPYSHIGVEIDGMEEEKFLVGEGALTQSYALNWAGGENKHKDFNFPVIAKTCLGLLAGRQTDVDVNPLVMGLPVDADESEERHKLLNELMIGKHKLTLYTADGRVSHKEIRVHSLITKKQPFGSFCDLILDGRGDIQNKEMAMKFNVVVDIGTRTLNIYVLDGLEPVTELCDTRTQGVHTAYDKVSDFIKENLNYSIASGSILNVIRKGEVKGVDLKPVIDRSFAFLANEVFKIVDTLLVNSWVLVDNLIITGGGSEPEVLQPYLLDKFPVQPIFLDRTATARGLWKFGVRTLLKEKGKATISLPNGGARLYTSKEKP